MVEQVTGMEWPSFGRHPGYLQPEEELLGGAAILVVGCGAVEAWAALGLAQAGVRRFTLLDEPDGGLEPFSWLPVFHDQPGRNRAKALAELITMTTPTAEVDVLPGRPPEDLGPLLDGHDLVIDGLGLAGGQAPLDRSALHQAAQREGVPAVFGIDLVTAGWVFVHDYRDPGQAPLDGLPFSAGLDHAELLARLISLVKPPVQVVRELERLLTGQIDQLPRLGHVAQLTGAVVCQAGLDLLLGQPVRRLITVDLAGLVRPAGTGLRAAGRQAIEFYILRRRLRDLRRQGRLGVFSPLDDEVFQELRPYMEQRLYETGSVVFHQDDQADEFFVILDGQVQIEREEEPDQPPSRVYLGLDDDPPPLRYTVLAELGPGDFFGEMALLDDAPRNATVVVSQRCTVLVLSRGAFELYLEESRPASSRVRRAAAQRREAQPDDES
jgi:CRP-like cAMP-binding protein